ncbi:MAG TPA: response regulator [Thermoflexia bacterium]|nr:response regulator [Thermoflexia bacterium]
MEDEIRLLLVDDERLVRRSMEKTLFRAGFDVTVAASAGAGLMAFNAARGEAEPFDLAILDLHMPNLAGVNDKNAGLELLSRLLATQADLPVIVLTAFDEVTRAKESIVRGARAYFVKGREAQLIDLINDILEL